MRRAFGEFVAWTFHWRKRLTGAAARLSLNQQLLDGDPPPGSEPDSISRRRLRF